MRPSTPRGRKEALVAAAISSAAIWSSGLFFLSACGSPDTPPESHTTQAEAGDSDPTQPERTTTPTQSGEISLNHGLDLSVHSGEVDWPTLEKQGFDFVYLKATEGVDLADPAFATHWKSAAASGMRRGAYHFYVTEDDPIAQADFFIGQVALAPGDLVPVVDVEVIGHETAPGLAGRLRQFSDRLLDHYGVRPMIYTSPNFWTEHLDSSFGDHPLWIAEYGVNEPRIPEGWSAWDLWQYADASDVAGVQKDADLSRPHQNLKPDRILIGATTKATDP